MADCILQRWPRQYVLPNIFTYNMPLMLLPWTWAKSSDQLQQWNLVERSSCDFLRLAYKIAQFSPILLGCLLLLLSFQLWGSPGHIERKGRGSSQEIQVSPQLIATINHQTCAQWHFPGDSRVTPSLSVFSSWRLDVMEHKLPCSVLYKSVICRAHEHNKIVVLWTTNFRGGCNAAIVTGVKC